MAKKIGFNNYRVEADVPKPWGGYKDDHKYMMREAEELREQIKRHCDQEGATIVFDDAHECEYCGAHWSEDSDEFNGGCCDKDCEAAEPKIEGS